MPIFGSFIVSWVDGWVETVSGQVDDLSEKFPGKADGLAFKVITNRGNSLASQRR